MQNYGQKVSRDFIIDFLFFAIRTNLLLCSVNYVKESIW